MEENKELSTFAKKYLKEISEDQPSAEFTANIMNVITVNKKQVVYQSHLKPSNSIWIVLSSFVVSVTYILLNGKPFKIDPTILVNKKLVQIIDYVKLPSIDFSINPITLYAFLFLGFFLVVQMVFIKKYYTNIYIKND